MRTMRSRPARKRFGQNFLEPAWVDKVVREIDPRADDTFIEIGPGRGALTRPLATRAHAVVAFEIDRDLAADLAAAALPNLTIVEGDFLQTSEYRLRHVTSRLRVAGNLPYNLSSPILFKLLDLCLSGVPVTDATLMLQREVADRLIADPGTKDYGVLTVLVGHVADIQRLLALPPGAFRPAPQVHSSLVRLVFHAPSPPVQDLELYTALVRGVFTQRRKTLANALQRFDRGRGSAGANRGRGSTEVRRGRGSVSEVLALAGLDGARRPETLTVEEFARLADAYSSKSR